jgi:hypothetical protein
MGIGMTKLEEVCRGESAVEAVADCASDVATPDAITASASCPPCVLNRAVGTSYDARLGGLRGQHELHPQPARAAA